MVRGGGAGEAGPDHHDVGRRRQLRAGAVSGERMSTAEPVRLVVRRQADRRAWESSAAPADWHRPRRGAYFPYFTRLDESKMSGLIGTRV
jgi:hypothetical protein